MAYAPIQIANELLAKHAKDGIDPLKLQKLLYYADGWWLALNGEPLLTERPQVWRNGPVYASIYRTFRRYGWQPIEGPVAPPIFGGKAAMVDGAERKKVQEFLDWIWTEYGSQSGVQLADATHASGTPWRSVAERNNFTVPDNTQIPLDEDRAYFVRLARERGFNVKEQPPA